MGKQKTLEELLEIVRRKESSEDPVEVAKKAKKAKKDKLLWKNLGDLYDLQLSGKDISHIPSYTLIDAKDAVPQTLPSLEANDWPDWLKNEYYSVVILRCEVAGFATKLDRKLSDKIKKAMIQHRVALHHVAAAIKRSPDVSEPAQTCFQMLLQHKKLVIETALNNAMPAWNTAKADKDAGLPKHNALHNQPKSWTRHFPNYPDWKERSESGKRWKVSNVDVVKELTRIDKGIRPPHPDTVNNFRNALFK